MNKEKTLTHNVNTEVKITTPSGLVMFSQMGSNVIIHKDQVDDVIDFLLRLNEVPYLDENGNVVEGLFYNRIGIETPLNLDSEDEPTSTDEEFRSIDSEIDEDVLNQSSITSITTNSELPSTPAPEPDPDESIGHNGIEDAILNEERHYDNIIEGGEHEMIGVTGATGLQGFQGATGTTGTMTDEVSPEEKKNSL